MTYEYMATVVRWIDGDTVELTVDLGFHLTFTDHFRLLGIDTPERGRPGSREATAYAASLAPAGTHVHITTAKSDKYGRWLADIMTEEGKNVGGNLLAASLARAYFGGAKDAS